MDTKDAVVDIAPDSADGYNTKRIAGATVTMAEVPVPPPKRPGLGNRLTTDGFAHEVEGDRLTSAGRLWFKLMENPLVRYCTYVLPVAAILAIPLTLFDTVYYDTKADGIRLLGLFIWLEIAWASLWLAKIISAVIPFLFQTICSIFSTGIRKYSLILRSVEVPLSLFIWAIMIYIWFPIIYVFDQAYHDANVGKIRWTHVFHDVLKATLGVTALFLVEKTLVQLISVNYHKKQYSEKIKLIKRTTSAVDLLYDASLRYYPDHHKDFIDEDIDIHDTNNVQKIARQISVDQKAMRLLGDMGWFSDRVTSIFHRMANDITGLRPSPSHSVVQQALERRRGAEALAGRIHRSLITPGANALHEADIHRALGPGREAEAKYIFAALDKDLNGDISLDEMLALVTDVSHQRKVMWRGACDIKDAIKILDHLLMGVVVILMALIYAAFFSTYLADNYSKIWTALTGLSFMLGATAAELLSSCILVFVKHPYDVGDRVDISGVELEVMRISLMYTVFRRIDSNRLVQIGNQVIAGLWTENVSRSGVMKERLTFSVNAATKFADMEVLRGLLEEWVRQPENRRDFFPDVEMQLLSMGDMKQLDLRVEIQHKSNWANETLRATRRSKFMCALLSAMRRVPIDGPAGSAPVAGSINNPNYSVAISDEAAKETRARFDADKDAKKLMYPDTAVASALELLPTLMSRGGGAGRPVSATAVAAEDIGLARTMSATINPFHGFAHVVDVPRPGSDGSDQQANRRMNNYPPRTLTHQF